MTQITSFVVSFIALAISIYGVFERQKAAYSAMRVRLTELLEAVEGLNVSEMQYQDDQVAGGEESARQALSAFASRRALLTYQALDLLNRLERSLYRHSNSITASEYGSLAYSLKWCGDIRGAREQWERAVAVGEEVFVPTVVKAANLRGLAGCLMEMGDAQRARETFEAAVSEELGPTDIDKRHVFDSCLDWLFYEMSMDGGQPEVPARLAHEIAATPGPWGPELLESLESRARTTVYVKKLGQYREVGLADLLKHSMAELVDGADARTLG